MDKRLIINRIKKANNFSTDTELANFLGIKKSTLSNWYTRNTIDYDLVFSKCEHLNLDWLVYGKDEIKSNFNNNCITEPQAKYVKTPTDSRENDLEHTIEAQKRTIETQQEIINLLKKQLSEQELDTQGAEIPDVD